MKIGYFSFPILREFSFLFLPLSLWRRRAINTIFSILRKFEEPDRILEVGCGYGLLSRKIALLFPNSKIYAIDASSKMIEKAKRNNSFFNLYFDLNDFFTLEGKYKLIISLHVMVLFPPDSWLKKISELLDKGGIAIVTVTSPTLFTKLHRIFFKILSCENIYLLNPDELKNLSLQFGFDVIFHPIDPYEGSYALLIKRQNP